MLRSGQTRHCLQRELQNHKIPWQTSSLVLSLAKGNVPPERNSKKAVFSYKNTFNPLHRAFSVDLVSENVIFASNSCVLRVGKKKVSQT